MTICDLTKASDNLISLLYQHRKDNSNQRFFSNKDDCGSEGESISTLFFGLSFPSAIMSSRKRVIEIRILITIDIEA